MLQESQLPTIGTIPELVARLLEIGFTEADLRKTVPNNTRQLAIQTGMDEDSGIRVVDTRWNDIKDMICDYNGMNYGRGVDEGFCEVSTTRRTAEERATVNNGHRDDEETFRVGSHQENRAAGTIAAKLATTQRSVSDYLGNEAPATSAAAGSRGSISVRRFAALTMQSRLTRKRTNSIRR
ncbi:hypothetical protein KM043_015946 [Ampulex compressa]|nr:hypothetical protein KM043_015946 [Ampulex compressa]